MHRIDGPGATAEEQFTQGDPAQAIPATVVTDDWLNSVQEELANVVESTGEELDKAQNDQLLLAIQQIIADTAPGIPLGQPFWHQGITPPDGCLEFAGQVLNRTTYADLWAALNEPGRNIDFCTDAEWPNYTGRWSTGDESTTFRSPDTRGDFIRAYNASGSGTGAYPMGRHYDHEFESHTHGVSGTQRKVNGPHPDYYYSTNWSSTQQSNASGGSETRPDQTSWMLCFRYR